jgi:hypothetical protein
MDLPLPPDFREFLGLLDSAKIEYLLVGGYAVSYHGYPRPTGDLDVWVAIHAETASKLVAALKAFGFGSAGASAMHGEAGHRPKRGADADRFPCVLRGVEYCETGGLAAATRAIVRDAAAMMSDTAAESCINCRPGDAAAVLTNPKPTAG